MRYGSYQGITLLNPTVQKRFEYRNLLFPAEDRHLTGMTAGWKITRYHGTKGRTDNYETGYIHPIT